MASSEQQIVIAGAGAAGLCLALAAAQTLGTHARISVVDPGLGRAVPRDRRALAIAPSSRRALRRLGVWDALETSAQPITGMTIAGAALDDPIRPGLLDFEADGHDGEPLAFMVEADLLSTALRDRVQGSGIALHVAAVTSFAASADRLLVRAGPHTLPAHLLVGADGADSPVRGLAGIPAYGWGTGQTGIVATVEHEFEHGGRARQHFLPAGPFAILPLPGRRSSIVWSERNEAARGIMALGEADFGIEIARRFGPELGEIRVVEGPRAYPLRLRVARRFVGPHLALVGDAAHVVHPLAGQGFNLGLRDVAALAECIGDAAALGLGIGDSEALARYQRWRGFDAVASGLAMDGLNRLFSNAAPPLRLAREIGLALLDRLPGAKRRLIREAAGSTGELPALMRIL